MRVSIALIIIAIAALASATLDPCKTNTNKRCLVRTNCKAAEPSKTIQAAECSHNTRTHEKQVFAVFVRDHKFDGNHGAPYGICHAYTCDETFTMKTKEGEDCWMFFWNGNGTNNGTGTGCIRDPLSGQCGCERSSDGKFFAGKTDCK
ncbi:hypothetical protein Plhal304r1_c018g0063351 [Plasmopara halstedii]